jgi:hypothetical protein
VIEGGKRADGVVRRHGIWGVLHGESIRVFSADL